MPMPNEYRHAQDRFDAFLALARDELDTPTSNATYTTVQAVFTVFRRRLTTEQAIRFASTLPALLRAMFVQDWDTSEPVRPFLDREAMEQEVRDFRGPHNFSPDASISKVARALERHVDRNGFVAILETISPAALAFWCS